MAPRAKRNPKYLAIKEVSYIPPWYYARIYKPNGRIVEQRYKEEINAHQFVNKEIVKSPNPKYDRTRPQKPRPFKRQQRKAMLDPKKVPFLAYKEVISNIDGTFTARVYHRQTSEVLLEKTFLTKAGAHRAGNSVIKKHPNVSSPIPAEAPVGSVKEH